MITLQTALHLLGNRSFEDGLYAKCLYRRIKAKVPPTLEFEITLTGTQALGLLLNELDELTLITIDDGSLFNRDEANAFLIESTSGDEETVVQLKTQYQQSIYIVIIFIMLCFMSVAALGYYYLNTRVINTINTTISEDEVNRVIDMYRTIVSDSEKSAK